MAFDIDQITSAEFWEDSGVFVAGEWEGEMPDVGIEGGCVLFQTSGTTGEAKWIVVQKKALMVSARAVNVWLGVNDRSVWGLALPLNHVGGFGIVARAYEVGCAMEVFSGQWDAVAFRDWITHTRVTHTSLVPTQVYDLVKAGIFAPSFLKAVVVGGGRLENGLGEAARGLGWPVLASFGMTEACSQIATQQLDSIGKPFSESVLELLPIWEAEVGEGGLLNIFGEALFCGMITREGYCARRPGGFTTKDRVQVDGRRLIPLGRVDLLVKVMGELVDIEAVEREFIRLAGDRIDPAKFAVVALPDERRGHLLVAVFEGEGVFVEDVYDDYQARAGGLLRFQGRCILGKFPKSELGKLRRGALSDSCSQVFQQKE